MALKDLLKSSDLSAADMHTLLRLAADFKATPLLHAQALAQASVVLYFNKPSTRTRLSMETAVTRLGGTPLTVGSGDLQLGRGETIEDTARVISRYASAFVIRTFADQDVRRFAAAASVPVINALTDGHHPLQGLADLLTLQEHKGALKGLRVVYVGDGNNITHSLMESLALVGAHCVVSTPEGYEPKTSVVRGAQALAEAQGGSVELVTDPFKAVAGADAVYADTWVSMGHAESERGRRLRDLQPYQVNSALMAKADPQALVLHCLPCHRGEEITAEVIDGPQSVVFDEAENRLHTGQAALYALTEGLLQGA